MKLNSKGSIITGLLFFVIGLFIFLNPDIIVKFISYFIGGVLVAYGLYKTVNYYIQDKRLGIVNTNELGFGITMIVLGILLICLAGTIEFLTRIVIGIYLLIEGITRIANTFYRTDRGSKFYSLLVVGILFISAGLYTIINANLPFQILGIIMIVYGIIDFISYFMYKDDNSKKDDIKEIEVIEEKKEKDNSDTTNK